MAMDVDMDMDGRSASTARSRRYVFAEKTNLVSGSRRVLGPGCGFIRGEGEVQTSDGKVAVGVGGGDLYGENINVYSNGGIGRELVGTGDGERRALVREGKKAPEIHVRSPTLVQKGADIHMNTERNWTEMNEEIDQLPGPELGPGTEHMHMDAKERRKHRHAHKHRHNTHKKVKDAVVDAARSI